MNREEINKLVEEYALAENLTFSDKFEHRLDVNSSKVLYSLVRHFKPQTYVEFGTSWGGSGLVAVKAMEKNGLPYRYVGFEIVDDLLRDSKVNIVPSNHVQLYGDITKNLDKVPEEIDFLFFDPDGDREITEWSVKHIFPRVKVGGIIQLHDWSVTNDLVYEGGSFPRINYLIELLKENKLPLKKIFSMWDEEDYKASSNAASFWEVTEGIWPES